MKRSVLVAMAVAVICLAGGMVEWSNRYAIASEIAEFEGYYTRDGKAEAEADIAAGVPKWKVSGLYRTLEEDSARLKRLGVQADWFAGCIVSDGILRYEYDYNSTIHSYYVRLVGEEITEEVLGPTPRNPSIEENG